MYGRTSMATAPAASGVLPFTGLGIGWTLLAAFVLIMAAISIWALIPRQRHAVKKVNKKD